MNNPTQKQPIFNVVDRIAQARHSWWVDPNSGCIRSRGSNLDPIGFLYSRLYARSARLEAFVDQGYAIGLNQESSLALSMSADNILQGSDSILLNEVRRYLINKLAPDQEIVTPHATSR